MDHMANPYLALGNARNEIDNQIIDLRYETSVRILTQMFQALTPAELKMGVVINIKAWHRICEALLRCGLDDPECIGWLMRAHESLKKDIKEGKDICFDFTQLDLYYNHFTQELVLVKPPTRMAAAIRTPHNEIWLLPAKDSVAG